MFLVIIDDYSKCYYYVRVVLYIILKWCVEKFMVDSASHILRYP